MTRIQRKKELKFTQILLKIPVPWVFVLTYLIGILLQLILPFNPPSQKVLSYMKIIGYVLFAIGVVFASWSLIIFHKACTTTTPGEKSKKLVTWGPYRLTRNPMYVSLILAYLGEAGFLAQFWPVLVLPLMLVYVNWTVIPLEENILKKDFKEEYEDYCFHVRRWL